MFSKNQRLSKRADFTRLFKQKPIIGKHLTIRLVDNNLNRPRIAVVVPNKISKMAVVRNKIKRQTREIMKQFLGRAQINKDFLIFFKKKPETKASIIKDELVNLLGVAINKRR